MTSSDFQFDTDHVDFGYCTIFESVRKTINLQNKSVLSQAYGFISAPEVSVCSFSSISSFYLQPHLSVGLSPFICIRNILDIKKPVKPI